ncbi:hypothetical protein FACS189437_09290 [Bacteroidia bacterium]|nr:hypothetical protein FACS189437_09290 [Bacteroidia bacterium]
MLTLIVLGVASMNAQVKIGGNGTTGPVAGAVLELDGAQGALLLPRVDTLAITSPTAGMQVYREADKKVYTYDGKSWKTAAADVNLSAIPGTVKRITHYTDVVQVLPNNNGVEIPVPGINRAKTVLNSSGVVASWQYDNPFVYIDAHVDIVRCAVNSLNPEPNVGELYYYFELIEYN